MSIRKPKSCLSAAVAHSIPYAVPLPAADRRQLACACSGWPAAGDGDPAAGDAPAALGTSARTAVTENVLGSTSRRHLKGQ